MLHLNNALFDFRLRRKKINLLFNFIELLTMEHFNSNVNIVSTPLENGLEDNDQKEKVTF